MRDMNLRALREREDERLGRRRGPPLPRARRILSLAMILAGGSGLLLAWVGFLHVFDSIGLGALLLGSLLSWSVDRRAASSGAAGPRRAATALRLAGVAVLPLLVLSAPSDQAMLARGQDIVTAVEAFAADRGRLPGSLEEVGVANPATRYGRWDYWRSDDPPGWGLAYGDYSRDGFSLYYESESGELHFDR